MKLFIALTLLLPALANGAIPLMVDRSPVREARTLTPHYKNELQRIIAKHSLKKIYVQAEIDDFESIRFAKEIRNYLKTLPIQVEEGQVKSRFARNGIDIRVKNQAAYLYTGTN